MTDEEKWKVLQEVAERQAKKEQLNKLLEATGIGDYILKLINDHECTWHNADDE